MRRALPAAVISAVALAAPAAACAQQLSRSLPRSFTHPAATVHGSAHLGWAAPSSQPPLAHIEGGPRDRRESTLGERFVGGWVVGTVVWASLSTIGRGEVDGNILATAFAAGSAAGVMVSAAAREGPRPLSTLAGTAVGVLPLVALNESEGSPYLFLLVPWVTTPLAGALAHGLAVR